ncbi:RDD family protein [Rubricoccus marinus]|uniref:RDD domain-containing protein n=1 Tax=Rubricoccus marinus TaxID=716817 RepID=A0A259TZ69_9BACT|nr:RDD family protein [Rubricoccus marinus]OZC03073.1 hypothetical protein BSZ36_08875 [Rubricoccus marinus]
MRPSDPTQYNPGSYDHEFDDPIDHSIFDAEAFPLASPWKRLGAVILDSLIGFGLALPGLMLIGIGEETNADVFEALGALVFVGALLALMVYQVILLSRDGQTIGKRVLNLRIVDAHDGHNPGFLRAFVVRSVLMGVLSIIPLVSLIDALMVFTENHQTLHDRLATTVVEDESPGAR